MAKTKAAVMYNCDECGGPITAKAGDAVHKVGSRTLGECCIGKPTPAKAPRVGPFTVEVPAEGVYGFYVVPVSGVGPPTIVP